MSWEVIWSNRSRRDLRNLDPDIRERVIAAIMRMAETEGEASDIRRLQASELWRLRVGDWRVIFGIDRRARAIEIRQISPRGRVYR